MEILNLYSLVVIGFIIFLFLLKRSADKGIKLYADEQKKLNAERQERDRVAEARVDVIRKADNSPIAQTTYRCGYCEIEIAFNAKACPSCGGMWPVSGRSPARLNIERILNYLPVSYDDSFPPWSQFQSPIDTESKTSIVVGALFFTIAWQFAIQLFSVVFGLIVAIIVHLWKNYFHLWNEGDKFLPGGTGLEKLESLLWDGFIAFTLAPVGLGIVIAFLAWLKGNLNRSDDGLIMLFIKIILLHGSLMILCVIGYNYIFGA